MNRKLKILDKFKNIFCQKRPNTYHVIRPLTFVSEWCTLENRMELDFDQFIENKSYETQLWKESLKNMKNLNLMRWFNKKKIFMLVFSVLLAHDYANMNTYIYIVKFNITYIHKYIIIKYHSNWINSFLFWMTSTNILIVISTNVSILAKSYKSHFTHSFVKKWWYFIKIWKFLKMFENDIKIILWIYL